MELHYNCNMSCRTCNIWKREFAVHRKRDEAIQSNDLFAIQEKLAQAGIKHISYVGGEPLLCKDIFGLMEEAKKNGLSATLITNGSLLTPYSIQKLIGSGLHIIIFSLDGTEEIHDTVRGKRGTFQKVVQNISGIQREKKLNKIKKPKVCIYTTVSRLNFRCIPSVLNIAQKADVNSIRFQLVSVVTEGISNQTNKVFQRDVVGYHSYAIDDGLKLSPPDLKEVRNMMEVAKSWSEEVGIRIQIENFLMDPSFTRTCGFVKNGFVVNPYGDVLPCPMLTRYSIGNILEADLDSLWGNDAHSFFIKRLNELEKLPICQECCVGKR